MLYILNGHWIVILFWMVMTSCKVGGGLMDKVSASQPRKHGFQPHTGHNHDSSYVTSSVWFQEMDSMIKMILISSEKLLHNRAEINMFKLKGDYYMII